MENVEKIFAEYHIDQVSKYFSLSLVSATLSLQTVNLPTVTLVLSGKENEAVLTEILKGYLKYVENVALPHFRLFLNHGQLLSKDLLSLVGKIVKHGGKISLSQQSIFSSNGIRKMDANTGPPIVVLNSLSINLARLAYQSNKDETYFRTKLALIMKPSTSALILKQEILLENIRQGLLPTLSKGFRYPLTGSTSIVVNLTGLNESIYDILGYSGDDGFDILKKVIKTANDVLVSFDQSNSHRFGVSLINDSSSTRFVALDSNKFGKLTHDFSSYSQGITITKSMFDEGNTLAEKMIKLDSLVTGGLYIKLDVTDVAEDEMLDYLSKTVNNISHFEIFEKRIICSACGSHDIKDRICNSCGSSNTLEIV
jgi:ribonucleoside-triphosphate reductase